jgi:hypothetical protein
MHAAPLTPAGWVREKQDVFRKFYQRNSKITEKKLVPYPRPVDDNDVAFFVSARSKYALARPKKLTIVFPKKIAAEKCAVRQGFGPRADLDVGGLFAEP